MQHVDIKRYNIKLSLKKIGLDWSEYQVCDTRDLNLYLFFHDLKMLKQRQNGVASGAEFETY